MAGPAVLPAVLVLGEEAALAALALLPLSLNGAILVDLEQLEELQLLLLARVRDPLLSGVRLLLPLLLLATAEAEDKVKGRVLLDRVVLEGVAVLELLASEDEALLVGWDALLVLDLRLHVLDAVCRLHLEGDVLPRESFHEDLHRKGLAKPPMLLKKSVGR